jgi:polar amino acid transport system substrate-binding protein
MNGRVAWGWAAVGLAICLGVSRAPAQTGEHRDLRASLGLLPGLIDSRDEGAFVDLVKAMDRVYPGRILINVYPMARSIRNLTSGEADLHLPALRDANVPESKLMFRIAEEKIGTLSNVIYSNVGKKLTRADIIGAIAKGGKFPYLLEATGGDEAVEYPYRANNQIDLSLKMLNAGRIDGFIHPQEEADALIVALRLGRISRSLYSTNDDIVAIPKGAHGDEVNRIVSECLRKLRASGELETLYGKIHRPYSDWQPSEMGW